ncbi:hypothetical protein BD779DRAFT_1533466 [Infundibulicybe gibba]|nr:hypothetical protein BD779DRAFT_1533466 [Infundibulicybe gibba]
MLLFGLRLGIFATTLLLVFGITLATAAHGKDPTGMLWMMVISRGIAGVGAALIHRWLSWPFS